MTYARTMTVLLAALWGVIAWEWTHRASPRTNILIGADATRLPQSDPRDVLKRHIGDLSLKNAELGPAIDEVRRRSGANIKILWKQLAEGGINERRRISVCLVNADLETALHAIVRSLEPSPQFGMSDCGMIVIAPKDAEIPCYLRMYDVRDLAPNIAPPPPAPRPAISSGGVGAVFMTPGRLSFANEPLPTAISATQIQLLESIMITGKLMVMPDDLPRAGRMTWFGGRMVLIAPPEKHRRVSDMLRKLRLAANNRKNRH